MSVLTHALILACFGMEEEGSGVHGLKHGMGSVAQRVRHSG